MKISISYRHIESPHAIKSALDRHVAKIRKLLKSYEPDLVQLHGGFEKQPHRAEYIFSANLSLPTGTLHANGEGSDAATSARTDSAERLEGGPPEEEAEPRVVRIAPEGQGP